MQPKKNSGSGEKHKHLLTAKKRSKRHQGGKN